MRKIAEIKTLHNRYNTAGKYCKDCTERHVGCHKTCEKYNGEKAKSNQFSTKIYQAKRTEEDKISVSIDGIKRMKKGAKK